MNPIRFLKAFSDLLSYPPPSCDDVDDRNDWSDGPHREYSAFMEDYFYILFVGYLHEWKGILDLVKAWKLVQEQYDFPVKLLIAGTGEDKMIKRIKDIGAKNMVLLGHIPKDECFVYMKNALFLVWTSVTPEPGASVIAEALYHGCPVLASDVQGAAPELISNEKYGAFYKAGNIEDLKTKIVYWLMNPKILAEKHKIIIKNFIEENKIRFDSKENCSALIKIYTETINKCKTL